MTPELRARITARNETAAGFNEVKRDAISTANAIEASGTRAASGLMRQNSALNAMAGTSRMAAAQSRNLVFQLNDIGVSLASGMNPLMVFAQQGSQIATIYGPEEGGVGKALQETGRLAVGLVTKFWPVLAVISAGAAALGGLQNEINKTSDVQVTFGDTAMAVWQTFAEGVYDLVEPAISGIAGWIGDMWELAQPYVLAAGNAIIGTFLGAFDSIKIAWNAFPELMGDVAFSAANFMLDGIEYLVNGTILRINQLKRMAGLPIGDIATVDFGFENPFEGAAAGVASDVAGALNNALGKDYLGGLFETISGKARENALTRLAEDADKAGKAAGKATSEYDAWADDGIGKMIEQAEKLADTMAGGLTDGVMSVWRAFRSGENVLEAISNKLMSVADQMLEAGIQSFFRSVLGGGFGGGWNIPTSFTPGGFYPAFPRAEGGPISAGQAYLVGERGPEMIVPNSNGMVIPNHALGGAGGGNLAVTVVTEVRNGNLVPVMAKVAGEVAGQRVNQQAPLATAQAQRNRKFG